jgi:hypothetical protein
MLNYFNKLDKDSALLAFINIKNGNIFSYIAIIFRGA